MNLTSCVMDGCTPIMAGLWFRTLSIPYQRRNLPVNLLNLEAFISSRSNSDHTATTLYVDLINYTSSCIELMFIILLSDTGTT
jgi:hypothetical protein